MNNIPLLMKRAELRELLAAHKIGSHTLRTLIRSGKIEKRYLPGVECNSRYALYSRSQVLRDVILPLTGEQ